MTNHLISMMKADLHMGGQSGAAMMPGSDLRILTFLPSTDSPLTMGCIPYRTDERREPGQNFLISKFLAQPFPGTERR